MVLRGTDGFERNCCTHCHLLTFPHGKAVMFYRSTSMQTPASHVSMDMTLMSSKYTAFGGGGGAGK